MLSRACVSRHAIIKKFARHHISKLDDLIMVLAKLSNGACVPMEYVSYTDRHWNKVHVPSSCMLDGVHSRHFLGIGVFIYHSETMGLAAVDRNTVDVSILDVVTFHMEIHGEVVFLHTVHNYALVAYDPSALRAEPALCRGDSVYLVGLSCSLQATSRKSIVTNLCTTLNIGSADSPCYCSTNMEVIEFDTDFGSTFSSVLTGDRGRVQALWASFSTQLKYSGSSSEDHQFVRGLPIYVISEVIQ